MDRVLEQRLFVGQEVVLAGSKAPCIGIVERIDDTKTPARVTVRWQDGCNGCRTTARENWFDPAPRQERPLQMVPPRAGITRLA